MLRAFAIPPAVFDGFVNPGLLAGLALCAVPLLIHLLNRQRHKPVQWAAMRFVMAAVRRTRRRTQLEHLLLLLLRILAVAALALAIARPFTGSDSPLAGLTESRRDVVVVLDGSASTGYTEAVESVHERIVDRARELVLELDGGRGDRARVIHAGAWPRLLSWTDPDQALAVIDALDRPTDEHLDLAAALAAVLEFAQEEAAGTGRSEVQVTLLSDLQRRSFRSESAPADADAPADAKVAASADQELEDVLDQLQALGVTVRVEDLGPRETMPPNLSVASVRTAGAVLGAGAPAEIRVTLANRGPTQATGVRVWIELDGERRPSQIADVPGRGEVEVGFLVDFAAAGDHACLARIDGDRLAFDDARVEIVRVPEPLRVLVVDGAPAPELERDAAGMLLAVLEPPLEADRSLFGTGAPFSPQRLDFEDFDDQVELGAYDVIWLADVPSVDPRALAGLEQRIAAGASLVVSLGAHVRLESYDERMYRADGSGLLPAELGALASIASRSDQPYRVREFQEDHPVLAFFADPRWKGLFIGMPVYQFVATTPLADARVLARLDDDAGSPLLIERAYDRGQTFLWTTSIDPSWTSIPEFPETLVPLVHELLRYAGRESSPPRNLAPGASVTAELAEFPRSPELVRPDGARRALEGEVLEVARDLWRLPAIEGSETERSGLYRIETQGAGEVLFAVQSEAREGDLERLTEGELESIHPALRLATEGERGGDDPQTGGPRRGELWRWLAALALGALVAEALWAAWIGHRRRIA